jgi:hypothetical protein
MIAAQQLTLLISVLGSGEFVRGSTFNHLDSIIFGELAEFQVLRIPCAAGNWICFSLLKSCGLLILRKIASTNPQKTLTTLREK